MSVQYVGGSGDTNKGYIQFNVPSTDLTSSVHVTSATLTLNIQTTVNSSTALSVHRNPRADTWNESSVTWNNKPSDYNTYVATGATGGYSPYFQQVSFDVTNMLKMTDNAGLYSFSVASEQVNPHVFSIDSKEDYIYGPETLQMTVDNDTAPSVSSVSLSNVGSGAANSSVTMNPNGSDTTYAVVLCKNSTSTVNCLDNNEYAGTPCGGNPLIDIGQLPLDQTATCNVTGLQSGYYYKLRYEATNYQGTTNVESAVFQE